MALKSGSNCSFAMGELRFLTSFHLVFDPHQRISTARQEAPDIIELPGQSLNPEQPC